MIKILIADDHPIIRKGVINIVSSESDMKVVCEAADGRQVMELLTTTELDILILDILMPEMNGFEVLELVKIIHPDLPVLMISAVSEQIYASKSLRLGASGFINKETVHAELVTAIRKILSGGIYLSKTLHEKIAMNLHTDLTETLHSRLSAREFQVLCLIGSGKSLTEIGKELNLNVKTVSTFRSRLLQKMELLNNSDLIRYCLNEGLVK